MRAAVTPQPARIAALWFGIQAVWSALLGVLLQARVAELAPRDAVVTYAWLAAGGAAVAAVVQVVAGVASDRALARSGTRLGFEIAGIALALPALLAFFVAPSLGLFAAALLVLQFAMNLATGPYQAAIPDAIDGDAVGRASAWMSAFGSAGSVVGLLIAAALHGIVAGVALAVVLAGSAVVTFAHLRRLAPVRARAERLPITGALVTVLVSRGLINVGFYTLVGFLFFFVHEALHVADARTTTGLVFVAFTVAGIAGAALAGRPADRYDKRIVISVAALAIVLAVGAFAAAPDVAVAFGAAVASGCAWGAFFTADWAIAYAVLPRSAMATAMGVWNLAAAVPQVIAPAVTAPLVTAGDARVAGLGPRLALVLVIVEFALGTAVLWRLPAIGAALRQAQGDP